VPMRVELEWRFARYWKAPPVSRWLIDRGLRMGADGLSNVPCVAIVLLGKLPRALQRQDSGQCDSWLDPSRCADRDSGLLACELRLDSRVNTGE
jgi:hypothetical protein